MSKVVCSLLLEDVMGYKETTSFLGNDEVQPELSHKIISKGSLLIRLSKSEITAIKEVHYREVNYQVYSVPLSNLYCFIDSKKLCEITSQQRDFLYAVEGLTDRLEVYKRLKWIGGLTKGSEVYVTIATIPHPVKGIVQYIGQLCGEQGKKFGVELLV